MSGGGRVILLGPQRYERTVADVASELFPKGPVATVTAGWQEWEVDDEALDHDLDGRSLNLSLYARSETVFRNDPELARAHKALQLRIRTLRRAYLRRLEHAYETWRAVDRMRGDDAVLGPERDAAFQAIRSLDAQHLERVRALREEYDRALRPQERTAVVQQRREIGDRLDPCSAIVVEGGHVPVLLNRLRLFGVFELIGDRTVVACAGGAMVLAPRVVFFHDTPPQGHSRPEAAEFGLGLFPGIVALPDARERLVLGDSDRVSRLARRFAPDSCVTLDGGSRIEWDGGGWSPNGARYLTVDGRVEAWKTAA